jgi:serine/threonine protein kinase/tetratricopeptide (TPR) repeat protein
MDPSPDPPSRSSAFAAIAAHFDALRDIDPSARTRALEAIESPDVRAEVARLLASHDAARSDRSDPLERGIDEVAAAEAIEALREASGDDTPNAQTTGRWEPEREIGRGGMGTVWLARRAGADFEQFGALKVLRTEDDDDLLRRFRAERRILAALEHPNIAKLLDGGTTDEGKPFVVMEYVDGDDLLTYADDSGLDVRERIELFRKVCSAVEHAHAALVVHRDLKPSNILVSRSDGEPKLLDFGIAKLLRADSEGFTHARGGEDDPRTLTGMILLTPEYASPEQVRGSEFVTVATDVYALGLVLYELLSGQRAQVFESTGATELARVVCDRDPPPPSQAATRALRARGSDESRGDDGRHDAVKRPHGIRPKQLVGDLDAIVMKTLRKEPEQRYASAAGLAEDLRRYLEGMPVRARRGTTSYRVGRFVRRNRLPLAAATAVFLLVVAASVALLRQATQLRSQAARLEGQSVDLREQATELEARSEALREQRDIARRENLVTGEVVDFLIDLFDVSRHEAARAETLTARELLDQGARRIRTGGIDSNPLVRASLLAAMGRAYNSLGILDAADTLLDESAALRREHGTESDGFEATYALVQLRRNQGRFEEAVAMAERALAGVDLDESRPERAVEALAGILIHQGLSFVAIGRLDEADESVRALETTLAATGDTDESTDLMFLRAQIALERGDLDRAESELVRAVAVAERLGAESMISNLLAILAEVQKEAGAFEQALATVRRADEIDRRLFGEDHPRVDSNEYTIAVLLERCGRFDEAERILEALIERDRDRYGNHLFTSLSIAKLASSLEKRGVFDRALALYDEALTMQREVLPADSPELANTLSNIGVVYANSERHAEAVRWFEQALAIREKNFPADHSSILTSQSLMAMSRLEQGDLDGAQAAYEAVYEGRRNTLGEHPETAGSLYSLAAVAWRKNDARTALERADESLQMYRRVLPGGVGLDLTRPQLLLGLILTRTGEPERAEPLLREAVSISSVQRPDHPMRVRADRTLAECAWRQGRHEEAVALLDALRDRLLALDYPAEHPLLHSIARQRGFVLRDDE